MIQSSRRILITGGAGFIGTHLYEKLLDEGAIVHVFDNLSEQIHGVGAVFTDPRVEFTQGDVCDLAAISDAVSRADVVYHLAAETGTGQSMYEVRRYVVTNEVGTATLLEAIANTNRSDIKLIMASSRSVYGEGAYRSLSGDLQQPEARSAEQLSNGTWDFYDELGGALAPVATPSSFPPNPGSIYAATKYSQEVLCSVFCRSHGISCTILRFQNVYGEGQSLRNPYTGIISIFYNRMRQGLAINIFEDGLESRDFVHVSDVIDALISSACNRVSVSPLVANVGSGEPMSVLKLAKLLSEVSGFAARIEVTGDFRVGDVRHCFADIDCARRLIGYSPRVDLRLGLTKFVGWAIKQPEYQDNSELAMAELANYGLTN